MPDYRTRAEEFSPRELIELGFWEVLVRLDRILEMETQEMTDFTEITNLVTAQSGTIDSAVTLLKAIHDELLAAGTDQTALTNLAANIEANTSKLADAVAANPDPAATPPPPVPPVDAPPPAPPTDGTGVADTPPPAPPADTPPPDAPPLVPDPTTGLPVPPADGAPPA